MKKIILGFSLLVLNISAADQITYSDLYGEIQMNIIASDKCLEEIAYKRSTKGDYCKQYWDAVGKNSHVYQKILGKNFSDLNTQGTFWTEFDWKILKNQIKKLIYTSEIIK